MSELDVNNLCFEEKNLHVPTLDELVEGSFKSEFSFLNFFLFHLFIIFFTVLFNGLKENFSEVSVTVVDCPDLTAEPYHLAGTGKLLSFIFNFNQK